MSELHPLVQAILEPTQSAKVGVLERFAQRSSYDDLCRAARALHDFAADSERNLYQRVRAIFQAHALYRYLIPLRAELPKIGYMPRQAQDHLLGRHYRAALDVLLAAADESGLNDRLASALAAAYHGLGFQLLAEQVQRSVRSLRGNRWMFRTSHGSDHPLRVRDELKVPGERGFFPVLAERTAVRMDLTHSGWSDIFFLGMDYPEGARVVNVSVDLAVLGRDERISPPITCFFRVIDAPVLRLVSIDLDAAAELTDTAEVFNYASDYLGLLKAAVIASGIVPPGLEGSGQPLSLVLESLVGRGRGIELVSQVNDIPKGSRLAVSTNLLAGLISVCMRATGQVEALDGGLTEPERRVVAGRAILGEWLGGSGGGWQDSGGIWPGIKLIEGVPAGPGDVELGSSRGRLLPTHQLLGDRISNEARRKLEASLVVVHGGMAANVGPILEMVTEKFLLGGTPEWEARQQLLAAFDAILEALTAGDMKELGRLTTAIFEGPLARIVPWVSNFYTESLIADARAAFGDRFWGFWMLGGMSGGGMGFIVDPAIKAQAEVQLLEIMRTRKNELSQSLPFAMDPVVYRFAINDSGTRSELLRGDAAILSAEYYLCMLPRWLQEGSRSFSDRRRAELDVFTRENLRGERAEQVGPQLLGRLLPAARANDREASLDQLLTQHGFDADHHERIRQDLLAGRIGLAKNRLPADTTIEDAHPEALVQASNLDDRDRAVGGQALERGEACVITLAAGAGSRWTHGAGTVKAIYPFARFGERFRTFLEVHLAKTRRRGRAASNMPRHVITTSYLTHAPIETLLHRERAYGMGQSVRLSPGRSIGLRLVPTAQDLRFAWSEVREQRLEERKQKVRDDGRAALLAWAKGVGEASDYRDNEPAQCLHPVGHFYEVANLLLNGTLQRLLVEQPNLKYAMLHNIDTLGADLDPGWLGRHINSGACLSFEVIERRISDRGGGLARVGGRLRLVEGLAFPREEDEAKLSYYNSMTTWISIDQLLSHFSLTREKLQDKRAVLRGVRALATRLPTYITLKEVKRRWGNAQEDVFVVTQFEKLWGDMSALPDVAVQFFGVPRQRGQQLKDVAELDAWLREGSRDYVAALCDFS